MIAAYSASRHSYRPPTIRSTAAAPNTRAAIRMIDKIARVRESLELDKSLVAGDVLEQAHAMMGLTAQGGLPTQADRLMTELKLW